MKINKIITFFSLSVVLTTIIRLFQIKYTIEFETGFFIGNFSGIGYFMLAAIFLAALLCGIFAFAYYKNPEKAPFKSVVLGMASFLPVVTITLGIIESSTQLAVNPMQNNLFKVVSILTALFFVLFGVTKFSGISFPDWTAVLPAIYFIIKMITDFAKISSLAIISDYILSISACCVMLLFFIAFAKLYNNIDDEKNFKKLFAFGLSSAVLSLSQAIAYFVVNFIFKKQYSHVGIVTNLEFLAFGIFIVVFIFTYFSPQKEK